MTGGFFGSPRARFGWLHRGGPTALVIVPPFGYEAVCSHRALRHLAEGAAAAGLTAVRFDLDGTGDSEGDDLEPDRLGAWLASIDDACNLARTAGAQQIVLAGIRLGATLAVVAAARRDDIAGIVTIAAVASGKALVREGRALQMQLQLEPAPAGATVPGDDLHEVVGFAQTAETRAALGQLDLLKTPRGPAPAMLVIDRDDLAPNDKLVAALRALGTTVEQVRLPGYVEMMLDPHVARIPAEILAATIAFAKACPALTGSPAPVLELAPTAQLAGITEELVTIDRDLTAVASTRGAVKRAVILANAGAVYRIGPNRLYVELARTLAAAGDTLVLRADLSGLGDSQPRAGHAENAVYGDHAIADLGALAAWARRQWAREVAVVGLCSGAYHAIKAALAHAIETIVPINPLTFFWKAGMPLDYAGFRVTTDAQRYKQSMRSAEAWKKLLRGEVDLRRVTRTIAVRVRHAVEHRGRDLLRRLRVPLPEDLGSELLALGKKGVRIEFVFAASDPGRALLTEQGGSAVPKLERAGRLSIEMIASADHTFTARWAHPLFVAAVIRALGPSS
ncbi:hypothetical protein BH11MYX1_BH11MYX1_06620 [soil metagenome]